MNWITKIIKAGEKIKSAIHKRATKEDIANSDWTSCCRGPILKKELEEISLIYQIIDDYEDFEKKEVVNFFKLTDNLYEYLDDKDKIKNFLLSKVDDEIKINKIKSDRNSVIYNYILEQCSKKIDKIFL